MLRPLVAGDAEGPILELAAPLSFWGGVDPESGRIIDHHHPQLGTSVTGTVLLLPSGRGSSSSSSVLAEAIRLDTAPSAIVLREPDEIIALGAIVAAELYGKTCPVFVASGSTPELRPGTRVSIGARGTVALIGG